MLCRLLCDWAEMVGFSRIYNCKTEAVDLNGQGEREERQMLTLKNSLSGKPSWFISNYGPLQKY